MPPASPAPEAGTAREALSAAAETPLSPPWRSSMTIALSPEPSTSTGVPEVLRRYRLAISLMFLIAGMTIGTWTARIPTIQHNIKMADGKLSVCLLLLAAGGLLGMRAAGRLIDRHG